MFICMYALTWCPFFFFTASAIKHQNFHTSNCNCAKISPHILNHFDKFPFVLPFIQFIYPISTKYSAVIWWYDEHSTKNQYFDVEQNVYLTLTFLFVRLFASLTKDQLNHKVLKIQHLIDFC